MRTTFISIKNHELENPQQSFTFHPKLRNSTLMDAASSPILNTLRFRGGGASTSATHAATTAKLYYHMRSNRPCGSSRLASPGNCLYYRGRFQKKLRLDRMICEASSLNSADSDQSHQFAVLIEVEGWVWFYFASVRFVFANFLCQISFTL